MEMFQFQLIILVHSMNIFESVEAIKQLYQTPNSSFSTQTEMKNAWDEALDNFEKALNLEEDPKKLEVCILDDPNWELSVDERIKLSKKAKRLGAASKKFLMDHYGYLAAHLDPSPEKNYAASEFNKLMNS